MYKISTRVDCVNGKHPLLPIAHALQCGFRSVVYLRNRQKIFDKALECILCKEGYWGNKLSSVRKLSVFHLDNYKGINL